MCSWCYGFANEINQLRIELDSQVNFQLIMGGLRPYNKQTISEIGDMLKEHWQHVEDRSGNDFNYNILKRADILYDTEPSSRAVITIRQISPEHEFEFFKSIQTSFYSENKDPTLIETFLELCSKFQIDLNKFEEHFESDSLKKMTNDDFELAASMGVRGFPSVVFKDGDDLKLLSHGYTTVDKMRSRLELV